MMKYQNLHLLNESVMLVKLDEQNELERCGGKVVHSLDVNVLVSA